MVLIDARVALNTGLIAGLLLEARRKGLYLLVAVPRLDADGDYTNVIDLIEDGRPVMTVTVERVGAEEVEKAERGDRP